MVKTVPQRNAYWQNHVCCNLFRYPFYIGYFDKTNGSGKRYLVCPSISSGARDMNISDFSRWRMAAMLDLAMRNIPNVKNNHSGVFVIPILVRNDTLFVFLVHLGPDI